MRRRVVVTGIGSLSPLGNTRAEAFARLHTYENCVQNLEELVAYQGLHAHLGCLTKWTHSAHWTRKTTRSMGDVSLLALAATEQALEEAHLTPDLLENGRTGVAYGSCSGSIPPMLDFYSMLKTHEVMGLTSCTYVKLMPQTTACNLSVHFHTHGRLITTSTACTSGSLALGQAAELIQWGVQDVMLAGGAEEFNAAQVAIFDTLFATSTRNEAPHKTPAPFDCARDGLVIGDGATTFVLEEFDHACARGAPILAELVGFGQTTDGTHITNPHAETMAQALRLALADAHLESKDLAYVSAHGTATKLGDIAEAQATACALARTDIPISSIKSYTGHTLGACGALEAALLIESLRHNWYPPTLNLTDVDPACAPLDYIQGEGRVLSGEYAMSNNFAFGGVNTSLIFRRISYGT